MERRGIVRAINEQRGMVGIETEDDGFTIVELVGDLELSLGDRVSWANGYSMGSETYRNETSGERGEVYVQNHSVSPERLRSRLLAG